MQTLTLSGSEVLEHLAALKKTSWLQDFVLTPAQQADYTKLLQLRHARVRQLQVR